MSLMVSISGVRGIIGESLLPDTVVRYAAAFGEFCRRRHPARTPVILGRDGRSGGDGLAHLAASTILATGRDVLALGVVPTPTVAMAVERERAAGGLVITASHNPAEWNGMKFIGTSGLFLSSAENEELWRIAAEGGTAYAPWNAQGTLRSDPSWTDRHIDAILALPLLDVPVVRARRLKVVADCVNASGSRVVPLLLERLGCIVLPLHCDGTGVFPHAPEPVPGNLGGLAESVRTAGADLGIAVDPDGDRLVLIAENGEPYGEEYTVATAVAFVLGRLRRDGPGPPPPVVVNLSTTRAVEDIASRFGATVIRTPVGEINVALRMRAEGAAIGGEGSGGVILPALHTGRDALVGIALVLQFLAESGGTLSALKSSLPGYAIAKGRVELRGPAVALDRLAAAEGGRGARVNTDDGLKLDYPDFWVHLRKSNTEPIIRIIAEAASTARARELVDHYTALVSAPG